MDRHLGKTYLPYEAVQKLLLNRINKYDEYGKCTGQLDDIKITEIKIIGEKKHMEITFESPDLYMCSPDNHISYYHISKEHEKEII